MLSPSDLVPGIEAAKLVLGSRMFSTKFYLVLVLNCYASVFQGKCQTLEFLSKLQKLNSLLSSPTDEQQTECELKAALII